MKLSLVGPAARVVSLFVVLLWPMATASHAAVVVYLKIDGIDGELASGDHDGWIELDSFSWGATNPSTHGLGGGKVSVQDLSFTKRIDKSSPILAKACCQGDVRTSATLEARSDAAGALRHFAYKIELENVVVTSVSLAGTAASDALPAEQVSLNFARIRWTYQRLEPATGLPIETISTGWDVASDIPLP